MKIFISAATSEFRACRDALASDLRAVGATEVKVQEDFQQGPRTLLEKLEAYVAECDRVILLVGDAFGAEPTSLETPSGSPRRSYTQWEYFFATGERLNSVPAKRKHIFVYFASADFPRSKTNVQDDEVAQLQRAFAETILGCGEDRQVFSTLAELRVLVLRDGFRLPRSLIKPCNLPYASLGSLFKGRDGFLSDLHDRILKKLETDGRAKPVAITQAQGQAICGLGGIGKTRLAVEYALRYSDDYSALLFVVADSPEHLKRGIADLALVLDLKEAVSQGDEEARFKAALQWLMEHPGWCLILDNVDDESTADVCEDLVSKLYGGHVIITSRLTKWSMCGIEALDLDVLDASSARDLLLERTPWRLKTARDHQAAEDLAGLVDGLALGLEQAGAFINIEQCSIPEYVDLWRNGDTEVTNWFDQRVMKYPRSVAVTWNATVQRVGSIAEALLRLLACFGAAPIPTKVITNDGAKKTMMKFFENCSGQAEPPSPRSLLTQLACYSMLKKHSPEPEQCVKTAAIGERAVVPFEKDSHGSEQYVSLHRVVRDITWRRVPEDQRVALLETAAELFDVAAPQEADRFENWAVWRTLFPHGESIRSSLEHYPRRHWNVRLLHGLALYHLGQNRTPEGEVLQRYAYELTAERLGAETPEALEAKSDLAVFVSDPQERLRLLRESLVGLERAFEKDRRPETEILMLAAAFNIAWNLKGSPEGDQEAEALLRRCVTGHYASSVAGPSHWRTLVSMRALANLLWRTDRPQEAMEVATTALDRSRRNPDLGSAHKDTLDSIHQVARFHIGRKELDEAERLLRDELDGREHAPGLGPQHLSTLTCFQTLLNTLWKLHRQSSAEELCRSRSRHWKEALGGEHPNTIACMRSLSKVLKENKKTGEARRAEVECALALARKKCHELQAKAGSEAEELLHAMQMLAHALLNAGDLQQAESLYRRLLDGLRHANKMEETKSALPLNNFALVLREQGKLDESLKCFQEALEIEERFRGRSDPKHPLIPHRLHNLSMVLLMLGRIEEARSHLGRAWGLKEGSHDVTSLRILWVRLAVALLLQEPVGVFLGQLKTLLSERTFQVENQVDDYWNVQSVLAHLSGRIPEERSRLLSVVVDAINEGAHFHMEPGGAQAADVADRPEPKLDDLDVWREQNPVSLESPWPSESPGFGIRVPVSLRLRAQERILANTPYRYWVVHPEGLVAGACAKAVRLLSKLEGNVEVEKDGEVVNGKSIIELMMLVAAPGSSLKITFSHEQEGHTLDPLIREGIVAPDVAEASYRCPKCAKENRIECSQLPMEHVCPGCGERNLLRVGEV